MHFFIIFLFAYNQTDRITLPGKFIFFPKIVQVGIHLANVGILKPFSFKINNNNTLEIAVIKKQVNGMVTSSDKKFDLLTHKTKTIAKFKKSFANVINQGCL